MIAMAGYAAWRQLTDARLLQTHTSRWTAASLDGWFQELEFNLIAAAQDPAILDSSPREVQRHLNEILLRSPAFRSTTLADARAGRRGVEIMTLTAEGPQSEADLLRTEWFYPAYDKGRYISEVKFDEIPFIILARAIQENGETVGVVAAEADLSWAYNAAIAARGERDSYVYVVNASGRPIVHENSLFVTSGEALPSSEAIRSAVLGQPMPVFYPGLNEQEQWVIGDYYHLEEVRWTVVAEQPLPALIPQFVPLAIGAAGVLLLGAIAAFVIAFYISRRVAQPVVLLQEGAQRIGRGDLDHRIALKGHDELADLAEEFNRMTGNLQSSQARLETWSHGLEDRVTERTTELTLALEQLREEAIVRENLLQTIREISSPVIPVMEGILVVPIVGTLDSERARRVVDDLLTSIERQRARVIIIDITGLAVVDTAVANALLHAARAAQLLGAQPILVGISPEVAETLVQLGVEIEDLHTAATLQEGLQVALATLHRRVTRT